MAIFKCKMCGGSLEVAAGTSVIECEYCGTQQTLPKVDDERLANLHGRANHFRRNSEYDKAMGIYEQILSEDSTDAEAYWSLVLCRYGIEYVEDPATHKRVPTINRAQFTAIYDDDNYKSALQYADELQKTVYEAEAKVINDIQKGILEISQKEEPFDVFICYKESDAAGKRTPDSVLANDLYHQLTQEGFKVFFARITLEDKLGSAYEPYIFAALNSAKVMVVLGTKPEYFNAIWVKNEWSRFLGLIKQGKNKILIPAYKDMDAYDLPDEFSHLQAQDMTKLGFMQDLIRGIKKITQVDEPKATVVKETVVTANANVAPLLERAFMFLEDGKWQEANEYCEKVLDQEPKNAEAYLGKLMAELRVKAKEALKKVSEPFDRKDNYQKAVRFADESLKAELQGYIDFIVNRNWETVYSTAKSVMKGAECDGDYKKAAKMFDTISHFKDSAELVKRCYEMAEESRLESLYVWAVEKMSECATEYDFTKIAKKFSEIKLYKDSEKLAAECLEKAEEAHKEFLIKEEENRKNAIFEDAVKRQKSNTILELSEAVKLFESISDWRDAALKIELCKNKIEELNAKAEADRIAREERQREAEKIAKRNKKIATVSVSIVCAVLAIILIWKNIVVPARIYNEAVSLMEEKNYEKAIDTFETLEGYRDSENKIKDCRYEKASLLMAEGRWSEAIWVLENLGDYKDSKTKIDECKLEIQEMTYNNAVAMIENGNIFGGYEKLIELGTYKDSAEKAKAVYEEHREKFKIQNIKTSKVGDYIFFGSYEQDNNVSNGKEEIEWLVLHKQGDRVLVISKCGLDCQPYNATYKDVTWETCTLRKWLNDSFVNNAFSEEEKAHIPVVTVSADLGANFLDVGYIDQGNSTQDRIFLLSEKELDLYFDYSKEKCKPTPYVNSLNVAKDKEGYCKWWLRTLYHDNRTIDVGNYIYPVDNLEVAVRPAMWIETK